MSYNTIPLRPEDFNRSQILRQKLLDGTINMKEASELETILENEKYMAIKEGNVDILAAVNHFLNLLDNLLSKHKKKRKLPFLFSASNTV